jgi:Virulence factor
MAEYQITRWRELPSMVTARSGEEVSKISLSNRFQEAIDEAAMRLGDIDADAYMNGWGRDAWVEMNGSPSDVAAAVALSLENEFSEEKIKTILDQLGAN